MAEVASAYVTLMPSFRGGAKRISQELAGPSLRAGAESGRRFSAGFLGPLQGSLAGPMAGLLAGIGVAAFARELGTATTGLQDAHAALTGLLGSGRAATVMMRRLREESRDSPIAHAAWLQGAQDLAYLGVEGKQAITVLRRIETALVASGRGTEAMQSTTYAMLAMANQGKATAEELNQMSQAGLPAWSMLAAHMGTSIENARKRVEDGLVDIEDVMSAVEAGGGDSFAKMAKAADASAATFTSSFARAKDNVIQSLAEMLLPVLDNLAPQFAVFADKADQGLQRLPATFTAIRQAIVDTGIPGGLARITAALQPVLGAFTLGQQRSAALGAAFQRVAGAIGGFLAGIAPQLQAFGASVAQVLGPGLRQIATIVTEQVLPALAGFLQAARPIASWFLQVLGPVVTGTLRGVLETVAGGLEALGGLLDLFTAVLRGDWSGAWNAIKRIATGALRAVLGLLQTLLIGRAVKLFRTALSGIRTLVQAGWKRVTGLFNTGLATVRNLVSTGLSRVVTLFRRLPARVLGAIGGLLGRIVGFFRRLMARARAVVSEEGVSGILRWFRRLPGRILETLKGLPGRMTRAGITMITGFIGGLRRKAGDIVAAVKRYITDKLPGFVRDALRIRSPSKVFETLGYQTAAGMALGIRRGARLIDPTLLAPTGSLRPTPLDRSATRAATAAITATVDATRVGAGGVQYHFHGRSLNINERTIGPVLHAMRLRDRASTGRPR